MDSLEKLSSSRTQEAFKSLLPGRSVGEGGWEASAFPRELGLHQGMLGRAANFHLPSSTCTAPSPIPRYW